MNKQYVYQGMLAFYNNSPCLVLNKNQENCNIILLNGKYEEEIVSYDELVESNLLNILKFNKKIRQMNAKYSGPISKFFKNGDKEYTFEDGSKVWFTSDTHFHHDNVISFNNRPFEDINKMNEKFIENWNSIIKLDDTVFHLGDFSWSSASDWIDVLNKLNGHKHLIVGNHDKKNLRTNVIHQFESISFQQQIIIEGRKVYLNHFPFLAYDGTFRNPENQVWQLFGHVHSGINQTGKDIPRLQHLFPTQYDVGVDNNNYRPISWNEVKEKITKQILNYESDI